MNIDMGQNRKMVDRLFTGGYLGQLSDIASGELRYNELRTLKHLDVSAGARVGGGYAALALRLRLGFGTG
jgi:hypothetical protein